MPLIKLFHYSIRLVVQGVLSLLPRRVAFSSRFATGSAILYAMSDGISFEMGYETLTSGTPGQISRDTVLDSILGSTAPLNFSGPTKHLSEVPQAVPS
jgi:hypothetical protein